MITNPCIAVLHAVYVSIVTFADWTTVQLEGN